MNWRGLTLSLDSIGIVVEEIADEAEASELVLLAEPLGERARGTREPTDYDYAPGLSVWFQANGSVVANIMDQFALAAWVEERIDEDERLNLEDEQDEAAQDDADECGAEMMRERAAEML